MMKKKYFIHESSFIDKNASIGENTKIWYFSNILNNCIIGKNCVIGQNVMIGPNVKIGNNCKIQNNVSIYQAVELEDYVFCGPSCVFTNVINPRSGVEKKDQFKATLVRKGATIGANATILCGNEIGSFSMIGAGSVVTKNVDNFSLVIGNPAKRIGWVSKYGENLTESLICPVTGDEYIEKNGKLEVKIKAK